MSRIRTVKPELFRHEELFEAEITSGLPLRLAFIGLLTVADCEGRFPWKPRTIKLDVLPHDAVDFAAILDALQAAGFIQQYEAEGKLYGLIPTFKKHQQISNREQERGSTLPEPPTSSQEQAQSSPSTGSVQSQYWLEQVPVLAQSSTSTGPGTPGREGKGREGEGKGKGEPQEGKGVAHARAQEGDVSASGKPRAPITANWHPSLQALEILSQQGISATFAEACIPEFRLYWMERGDARPGWDASFVNSVKRSWEKRPPDPAAEPTYKTRPRHMTIMEWEAYKNRHWYPQPTSPDPFGQLPALSEEVPALEGSYERTH